MTDFVGANWTIKNFKGVIFDKDGTIIDSHIYWGAIIKKRSSFLVKKMGLNPNIEKELSLAMGYSGEMNKLLPEGPIALRSRNDVIEIVVKFLILKGYSISFECVSDAFIHVHNSFIKEISKYSVLLPGVKDLLLSLNNMGISIALVTSDTKANSELIIKHLGIEKMFDTVMGRESCSESKESGVPAKIAAKHLGVNAKYIVAIGDAPVDSIMSDKAGLMASIAVASGQVPMSTLSKYSEYVCNALTDIKVRN